MTSSQVQKCYENCIILIQEISLMGKMKLTLEVNENNMYEVRNDVSCLFKFNSIFDLYKTLATVEYLMKVSYLTGEKDGGIKYIREFVEELKQ